MSFIAASHHIGVCLFCNRRFSIGVTTGIAFCGVVGHTQRHEYTGEFHVSTHLCISRAFGILNLSLSNQSKGQHGRSADDKVS